MIIVLRFYGKIAKLWEGARTWSNNPGGTGKTGGYMPLIAVTGPRRTRRRLATAGLFRVNEVEFE